VETVPLVLIIEDNPVNLELVLAILEPAGYEVRTAETAERGLRLAATTPPALIVMDLHLPGMTGFEPPSGSGPIPPPSPSP
jgi:CheY-like chemotaxis protein